MVSNAHAAPERDDPAVRQVLDLYHEQLTAALRTALRTELTRGRLRPGTDPDASAEQLALLAYGVNLRSRAGANPAVLSAGVTAALDSLRPTSNDQQGDTGQ